MTALTDHLARHLPHLVTHRPDDVVRGYDRAAVLSPDGLYRYALTRPWAAGRWCVWVMLNPSTADGNVDDATIRRCVGFTKTWGYAGLVVVNAFAVRARDPRVMLAHPDPVGPDNDGAIATVLGCGELDLARVMVAWGNTGRHLDRDHAVVDLIAAAGLLPLCLGVTDSGAPRHPLRMRADLAPVEYRGRTR